MDSFAFNRTIKTEERFFQIVRTIPNLNINIKHVTKGIPATKVEFYNTGTGVVFYKYQHQGLIGLSEFNDKLERFINE